MSSESVPGEPDPGVTTAPAARPDPEAVTPVEGTPATSPAAPIPEAPVLADGGQQPLADGGDRSRRRRALVLGGLGAAVVAVGLAVVVTAGDDGDVATAPSLPTTTTVATTPSDAGARVGSAAPETAVPLPGTEAEPDVVTAPPTEAPASDTTPAQADPLPPDTTTTTAPAPPPPPPEAPEPTISGFRATSGSVCDGAGAVTVTLVWQSSDADTASVAGQSGLPPSGSTTTCALPGTTLTLVVTGPGGSDDDSVTVP